MISANDRTILRNLAKQVVAIADLPIQAERRTLWKKHNSLHPARPMILVFPEGAWIELLPPETLQCEGEAERAIEAACAIELALRKRIYYHDHFQDATVIENEWVVSKVIHNSGWGLERKRIYSAYDHGAWRFAPVIKEPGDLEKLTYPKISYDEAATQCLFTEMQDLFGDILAVKLKGVAHLSYHLMEQYTALRGLQEVRE